MNNEADMSIKTESEWKKQESASEMYIDRRNDFVSSSKVDLKRMMMGFYFDEVGGYTQTCMNIGLCNATI